ncbi:MAG: TolC family protein [Elusimicrobia bacterium]|nr:TolC family protein [Elusimicrobiota bacterium]
MVLAFFLALLAVPAPAQPVPPPPETYTLEEALHKAARNSPEVQVAEHDIVIAEQRTVEARFQFYPEVGLQALAARYSARYPFSLRPEFRNILLFPSNRQNIYSGQAYMTLSLYEGGKHVYTLRLAETALKQARAKLEAAKLDVKAATSRAWHAFLLAQERLAATEELLAQADKAPSRSAGGLAGLEIEALEGDLRAQAGEEHRKREDARLDFLKVLNRELDTSAVPSGTLQTEAVDVDLRRVLLWAVELRPELQAQTYRAHMDAIAVNLALGRRTPSVLLGLDTELTGQTFPLNRNNWDATVAVRLPFSLDFWTQHTQKLSEQRQSEVRRAELRDQVHLEVRKAHGDLVHWQAEWPRRESEWLRLKELRERAQMVPGSVDWLKASALVLASRKRLLDSVAEHAVARTRLERAVGRALPAP